MARSRWSDPETQTEEPTDTLDMFRGGLGDEEWEAEWERSLSAQKGEDSQAPQAAFSRRSQWKA